MPVRLGQTVSNAKREDWGRLPTLVVRRSLFAALAGLLALSSACDSGGGSEADTGSPSDTTVTVDTDDTASDTQLPGDTGSASDGTTAADASTSDVTSAADADAGLAPGLYVDPVPVGGFGFAEATQIEGGIVSARLVVDAPDGTFGVAFRMAWDPAVAELVTVSGNADFASGGIVEVVEAQPGLVVGVVSSQAGEAPLALTGVVELATIELRPLVSDASLSLDVLEWHSGRVDGAGAQHRDLPVAGLRLVQ